MSRFVARGLVFSLLSTDLIALDVPDRSARLARRLPKAGQQPSASGLPCSVVLYPRPLLYMSSASSRQHDSGRTAMTLSAARLASWHTYLSFAAFFSALFIGTALHYKKIVKNDVAGWPEEWFPSVSATYVPCATRHHAPRLTARAHVASGTGTRSVTYSNFSSR